MVTATNIDTFLETDRAAIQGYGFEDFSVSLNIVQYAGRKYSLIVNLKKQRLNLENKGKLSEAVLCRVAVMLQTKDLLKDTWAKGVGVQIDKNGFTIDGSSHKVEHKGDPSTVEHYKALVKLLKSNIEEPKKVAEDKPAVQSVDSPESTPRETESGSSSDEDRYYSDNNEDSDGEGTGLSVSIMPVNGTIIPSLPLSQVSSLSTVSASAPSSPTHQSSSTSQRRNSLIMTPSKKKVRAEGQKETPRSVKKEKVAQKLLIQASMRPTAGLFKALQNQTHTSSSI